jgi:hypothetical protein
MHVTPLFGTTTPSTDGLSNAILILKPSPIIVAISGIFLRHRTGRRP